MEKIKMLCLPYAGAASSCYYKWRYYLDSYIEIIPVELAGHGKRFGEPFYGNFQQAINDIVQIIQREISNEKYVIFGHSMGSILAYESVLRLKDLGRCLPIHIILSGRTPPNINTDIKEIYQTSDQKLLEQLMEMGGTSAEVINNHEIIEMFLPIIRADYKLLAEYIYDEQRIVDCDISVFYGKEDPNTNYYDIKKWDNFTRGHCHYYDFPGNHFFINKYINEVTETINRVIKNNL